MNGFDCCLDFLNNLQHPSWKVVGSGFNAAFTIFWKLYRNSCAWSVRSFNCKILLFMSFNFEFKFPLLFVEILDVASILNVSLILVDLKQFDKVNFSLLSLFLFSLLSSVFSTIWVSQLNSLFIMILTDKLIFGLSTISRSLEIKCSIESSMKLLLQWLILFRPMIPRAIPLK